MAKNKRCTQRFTHEDQIKRTGIIAVSVIYLLAALVAAAVWEIETGSLSAFFRSSEEVVAEDAPVDQLDVSEIITTTTRQTEPVTSQTTTVPPETKPMVTDKMIQVQKEQENNSEIIGLLEAGDDFAEYVVQGSNNSYYLERDHLKNYSYHGAAFLDYRCMIDPRSTNWIIHGHNMKDGKMFGPLMNYKDPAYLQSHPLMYLTLSDETQVYVPFAVVDVEVNSNYSGYFKITEWDFESDESFNDYVGYYKDNAFYEIPVDVQPDDHLLILSTCSYTKNDGRRLICCRMLREGESEAELKELLQNVE